MKRQLEILHLRLNSTPPSDLVKSLYESVKNYGERIKIKIYRRTKLKSDLGIHIHIDSNENDPFVSEFSERLASELKELGMVERTVWIEED